MPNFDPEKYMLNKIYDACMSLCALLITTVLTLIALLCLYDPTSTIFLGGYVPVEFLFLPVRLLLFTFHGYLLSALATNLVLTVGFVGYYILYLLSLLSRELNLKCRAHLTGEELRTPRNLRLYYRGFQVLNAMAMSLMGWMIPVYHGIFIVLPTFFNFSLIQHWGEFRTLAKVPPVLGSPGLVLVWSMVILVGRHLHTEGGRVLWSWRRQEWTSKEMKKFMKSCRPVVLSYGTQFVIQKHTLFNYIKAVTRCTFKAVLAARR